MTQASLLNLLLLVFGAGIMFFAIILYFKLHKNMGQLKDHLDTLTKIMFRLYIVLMIFFLVGYLYFIYMVFQPNLSNEASLVSYIFFFGAIFVLIGIIVQLRLTDCIFKNNMQIVTTLVSATEARDINLKGHSVHVFAICNLIYEHLPQRISAAIDKKNLAYASILHDIGKMGIPEAVLNKEGKLTEEEWGLIRNHPKIGVNILRNITGFESVTNWIMHHHERLDGSGYYGLTDIPTASRIISVADAYSAIIMRRSYKEPMTHEQAIDNMKKTVGTQFDREIFNVFCNIDESKLKSCLPLLEGAQR